jgi:outer membrane protein TolC
MSSVRKTVGGLWLASSLVWSQGPSGSLSLQEALDSTLRLHPQAHISEQRVLASRGVEREASGIFDPVYSDGLQQTFASTPLSTAQQVQAEQIGNSGGPSAAALNVTGLNAGATRLYSNGITAGPVVEIDRTRDRLLNASGINQSRLAYQMTIPLLRNRGRDVVAAQVTAAGVQLEASKLDLNQTFSDLLTNTAISYWQLAGANQFLKVARSSEERGQTLLQNVVDLIQADHAPRNDINQVRANLAERVAGRIAAEQEVVVARQQLALDMGLSPESMAFLPDPGEDLPEGIGAPQNDQQAIRQYIQLALSQRADYLAAQKRVEAERTLLARAQNGLRPSVDLTLSTGYSGLRQGVYPTSYLTSLYRGVHGPDAMAGVRYEFAPRNNAAAGRLEQTAATIRQSELRAEDTARSIAAAVLVALAGVRNAVLRLEKASESVTAFRSALEGEREKYRLGFGALVDILTIEDRLTSSQGVQVQARLDVAIELAHLRQATGTLIGPNTAQPRADHRAFVTVPVVGEQKQP